MASRVRRRMRNESLWIAAGVAALAAMGLAATFTVWRPLDASGASGRSQAPQLEFADGSTTWNWNWPAPDCRRILAEWLAPQGVGRLRLTLIDPATHVLDLPLRAIYKDELAGAWCERSVSGRTATLNCAAAPLPGSDPEDATTALTGALAQAVTHALRPTFFADRQGRGWNWQEWRPLVIAGIDGGWTSACPPLVREASHE